MATGDLEGNLERLRVQLRMIGYPHPLDVNGLKEGSPAAILPLLHFALLGYSRHVAGYLADNGYPLFAKNDLVCKKKHSELVKQARQAQQARKTAKRTTTLSEIVRNIDAANMDSLHMDETVTMALERVSRAQECPVVKIESETPKINDAEACTLNPSHETHCNDGKAKFARRQAAIENRNSEAASFQANECVFNDVDKKSSSGNTEYDVDPSLSHCYEKLRAQIVEVAERMEKLILTLKGDVQRITSDMQVKLTSLERRAQHLEQTIPSKHFMEKRIPASDINLLRSYDGGAPFKRLDESIHSHALMNINNMCHNDANIHDMEISQNQTTSFVRGLLGQQEQISTKELIASVKARCNKTKELLMGKGWAGLT